MEKDPRFPCPVFSQEERIRISNLRPGAILSGINGRPESSFERATYNRAAIEFLKFLELAGKGLNGDANIESSIAQKLIDCEDVEIIPCVYSLIAEKVPENLLVEAGLRLGVIETSLEEDARALNFLYTCEGFFPQPIYIVERWD